MAKETPLTSLHSEAGGKMVEFAGWKMPVEFEGLRKEHERVRNHVGLFDVSHMGEIRFRGVKALESLQWMTTNDVSVLKKGDAQYSLIPNNEGGIVDDIIVYCIDDNDYMVCVNAANREKDLEWFLKNNKGADVTDESDLWAQIAVQGPSAIELVARIFGSDVKKVDSFKFVGAQFEGATCWLARTGYTGEQGFEIFVEANFSIRLWKELLEKGKDLEVGPIGLGARDTLRTEMKYSLYGHEIDDSTNPYSAGLGWVVRPQAKDFVGKQKILAQKESGLPQKLVGLKMIERGIPRHGYKVFSFDNQEIGIVTSGTVSPSLNENIGIAYVNKEFADVGTKVNIEVRQKQIAAEIVATPFYQV